MTDYLHMADLCTAEISRLRRLRATYLRAHCEQQAQRSRGLEQLDLTDAAGIVVPPAAWHGPCPAPDCLAMLSADTPERLAEAQRQHLLEAHARR
jgi:hypothetical protein